MRVFAKIAAGTVLAASIASARPLAHRALFPGAETRIPSTEALERIVPGARRIELTAADGTALAAAWMPARSPRAVAVYFHATNQAAGDAIWLARDLVERGMGVCLPEHRGYGGLDGEPTVERLLLDAEAALATCPGGPGPRVLVGRSLGAGVAAEMAARGHGDALVLVSPFTALTEVAGPAGWALAPDDRLDLRAAIARVEVRVTVLHGTRDLLIPFRMGQEIARAAGARFVPLPGVGHNQMALGAARVRLLDEIERAAHPPPAIGLAP